MSFLLDLHKISVSKKIITKVHWEVISTCNLECKHCYIDDKKQKTSLTDSLNIINYLYKLGVLHVVLSGGEALLHPNFKEIYLELKNKGMLVTIFTNGTLLNAETISLFNEFKPYEIEISVYGGNEESFSEFTNKKGMFDTFIKNIKTLALNQNLKLKTPLTKSIYPYLKTIDNLCSELNIPFTVGKHIYPSLEGNNRTLNERLSVDSLVKYELTEEPYGLMKFKQEVTEEGFNTKRELRCSASKDIIIINADMSLSFCGMLREPKEYFSDFLSLKKAIENIQLFRTKIENYYNQSECSSCAYANLCTGCPALSWTHNKNYTSCIPYFKEYVEKKLSFLSKEELSKIKFASKTQKFPV
jgi:radical SAM protein with 4Fe4S-binding SPASM domain